MASNSYFEETLKDKQEKDATIDFEVGTSSFYGEQMMAVRSGEMTVILDHKQARELCEAVASISNYLGYNTKKR